jgi:NAD(P)-dependent dehydrogenase (short-subunit alcohol dehydrogenase family)
VWHRDGRRPRHRNGHRAAPGCRCLDIALESRDQSSLSAAASEVERHGVRALSVCADLCDPSAADRIVATVLDSMGRIDVIVNNAAAQSHRRVPLEAVSPDELQEVMAANVGAPLYLVRSALEALRRSDSAAVVNVSSAATGRYVPDRVLYGAVSGTVVTLGPIEPGR